LLGYDSFILEFIPVQLNYDLPEILLVQTKFSS
jgi:hypothetical protein